VTGVQTCALPICCQISCRNFSRLGTQGCRFLPYGDGVEIDHAVNALVGVLQADEVANGAEVVAEVQIAGGLHAGENALHYPESRRQRRRFAKVSQLIAPVRARVKNGSTKMRGVFPSRGSL